MKPTGDPESMLRRAEADLWRHTLSRITSLFGRLVYLASLRDPNTGRYEHYGLAQLYGDEKADEALRRSHARIFSQWLSSTLEQQRADLQQYLAGLGADVRTVLETWSRLAPYQYLVPTTASQHERRLYLADLQAILDLLKSEYGVACLDPDA